MPDDRRNLWLLDVAVLVLAALLFGLGTQSQLWDRDEPRYAEASRQMLLHGDLVEPQFNGEPRNQKPPGIYWLQSASYAMFGVNEMAARLPAVLFSAFTCLMIFRFVRIRTGRLRAAWLGVAAFALCPMTMIQAGAATTDAVLLALITFMLLGWFRLTASGPPLPRTHRAVAWCAWYAALAFSLLIKFPVPVASLGMAGILYYGTDWRELRRLWNIVRRDTVFHAGGLALLVVVLAPWLIAALQLPDNRYLRTLIFREIMERAASGQEGHSGPFFYYLIVLPILWLPWPLLLWLSWRRVPELLDRAATRWLACAAAGTVIIFSAVSTKLPHYVYPAYPPLAMLVGVALDRSLSRHAGIGPTIVRLRDGWGWWRQAARVSVTVVCWLTVVAGVALPAVVFALRMDALLPAVALAGLTLIVAADAVAVGVFTRNWHRVVAGAAVGTLLFCLVGRGLAMPAFDAAKPARAVAAAMHAVDPDIEGEPLHCLGYAEDSLAFYTHCQLIWQRKLPRRDTVEFWQWVDHTAAESPKHRAWLLVQTVPPADGRDEAWPSLQDSQAAFEAANVPLRATRLCRIGPFLHYNRGNDLVFGLELWLFERDATAP